MEMIINVIGYSIMALIGFIGIVSLAYIFFPEKNDKDE